MFVRVYLELINNRLYKFFITLRLKTSIWIDNN